MERAREVGWHVKLHIDGDDVVEFAGFLDGIRNLTVLVDHMAHLNFAAGLDQPACRWLIDKLKNDGNWWMMCSNGNRDSEFESGYDDAVPFGKAFIAAAPDRMVWGTDWPHVNWRKKRMMNDAETVELFYRYVDNDPRSDQEGARSTIRLGFTDLRTDCRTLLALWKKMPRGARPARGRTGRAARAEISTTSAGLRGDPGDRRPLPGAEHRLVVAQLPIVSQVHRSAVAFRGRPIKQS